MVQYPLRRCRVEFIYSLQIQYNSLDVWNGLETVFNNQVFDTYSRIFFFLVNAYVLPMLLVNCLHPKFHPTDQLSHLTFALIIMSGKNLIVGLLNYLYDLGSKWLNISFSLCTYSHIISLHLFKQRLFTCR